MKNPSKHRCIYDQWTNDGYPMTKRNNPILQDLWTKFCQDGGSLTHTPQETFTEGFKKGMEKAMEVTERSKFKGEYKDCPAAWVTDCFDKFSKSIKSILNEMEES